jgi:SAM-dependent methyltransferase
MADDVLGAIPDDLADATLTAAMHEYYELGQESDRLASSGQGRLEFERTQEILLRALPAPPATVADIGGGPGRYALWLSGLGYRVLHRDLMPLHVRQLTEAAGPGGAIDSRIADARSLDIADASVDAVLLLGPLYHLEHERDRLAALAEARRIVRPGGPVFAAAISRWAARLDAVLRARLYEEQAGLEPMVDRLERTGVIEPLYPGSFCGFTHRPDELRGEASAAGLEVTDLVCVEGASFLLGDLADRSADGRAWQVVLDAARAHERVPELMGIGSHLLVTARRP